MYRRIMYSVAERIAHIEGAKAIVTGESLGQVASQTLENIMAVNEAVKIPVFRPLIGSTSRRSSHVPRRSVHSISRLRPLPTAARCLCRAVPRRTLNSMPCMRPGSCSIMRRFIERLLKQTEYIDFESNTYKAPKTLKRKHSELAPREIYQDHE